MRGFAVGTIPVRISSALYGKIGQLAQDNRRTIRAEIELMLEEQLAAREAQPKLERRTGKTAANG